MEADLMVELLQKYGVMKRGGLPTLLLSAIQLRYAGVEALAGRR